MFELTQFIENRRRLLIAKFNQNLLPITATYETKPHTGLIRAICFAHCVYANSAVRRMNGTTNGRRRQCDSYTKSEYILRFAKCRPANRVVCYGLWCLGVNRSNSLVNYECTRTSNWYQVCVGLSYYTRHNNKRRYSSIESIINIGKKCVRCGCCVCINMVDMCIWLDGQFGARVKLFSIEVYVYTFMYREFGKIIFKICFNTKYKILLLLLLQLSISIK